MRRGGINVIAGIDIDPLCKFPYEQNNFGDFIERDVRELTGDLLQAWWKTAKLRLLAGCAPCQPFSTYSRKGRHLNQDTKWELVSDFGRLIQESQPDLVTMENVPQLIDHKVFRSFVRSLDGYHISYSVVECSSYGVPQTRRRLVLLASRFGPITLLPPSHFKSQPKATVRRTISNLPPLSAGEADPNDTLHCACRLSNLNLQRIKASRPGGTWRDWDDSLVAHCHTRATGATYPSVYGRMEWDAPAPTITTQCFGYGNGRFGHPEQHRAITLREAALLQTFPKSYRFLKAGERVCFSTLGRLIGNAVPVRIGEVVALSITRHVSDQHISPQTKT